MLDFSARAIQTQSAPENAGTKHLTSRDFVRWRFLDAGSLSVPSASLLPASKNLHMHRLSAVYKPVTKCRFGQTYCLVTDSNLKEATFCTRSSARVLRGDGKVSRQPLRPERRRSRERTSTAQNSPFFVDRFRLAGGGCKRQALPPPWEAPNDA